MFLRTKNRAESSLAAGIDDDDLSLSVGAGEGALFPDKNFHITIDDEILLCSSRSTDVLTVVRAQEGTAAAAHSSGATVELRITSGIIEQIQRGGGSINVETLAGDKTLTPGTDEIYQYLDEGGANRIITLDTASASAGDRFVIRHNGAYNITYYLQIKQAAVILDQIYAGAVKEFIFDGTNWISGENGTGENDNKNQNISIGYKANGTSKGVAIGYQVNAQTEGLAVGYSATGYQYGVALGKDTVANNSGVAVGYSATSGLYGVGIGRNSIGDAYGVAIGYKTDTNEKRYSVALGYRSATERYSEIAHNINGGDSDQENNITIGGFEIQTANNTPTEMLCGGYANQRFTIRPSSVLTFTILITARDNVSGDCAAYKVEGAIKRDAANNTAMLAAASITVIHEDDATWDVAVAADDTNEALVITVTGDDTNITQWAARLDGVETHF